MAGIGFVIRKLARKDDLIGPMRAYAHAAIVATGPWILTVATLALISVISENFASHRALIEFRHIIIYNFAFSLTISSPVCMIATRYLADAVHRRDLSGTSGLLLGGLFFLYALLIIPISLFYFVLLDLSPLLALSAVVNFFIISGLWYAALFVSALKDYAVITRTFFFGFAIAVVACTLLMHTYQAVGIVNGFSIGCTVILFFLIARIFTEFPFAVRSPFAFLAYFKKHWEIALGALAYNAGIWIDKWIMWFAPEAEHLPNGMISYPAYDSAMFLAQLTVIPIMAGFVFSVETSFYEHYVRFYEEIRNHASLEKIGLNHQALLKSIRSSVQNFIVLQGSLTVIIILTAPQIFEALHLEFLQLAIFRFGVLGSFFLVLALFVIIVLSYFDSLKRMLLIQGLLLVFNLVFTLISLKMGFRFYGYGFCIAAMFTFFIAVCLGFAYVLNLPYHTFISKNSTVGRKWYAIRNVVDPAR